MSELDLLEVEDLLAYYPEQGVFIWKRSRRGAKAGSIAGCECPDGVVRVMVKGHRCLGHELAWAMHHGEWPRHVLRHRNGNRLDNRIANLM